jgi:ribosomal protein S18 acetylase RimI-like enzyme
MQEEMNVLSIRPATIADAEVIARFNAAIALETEHITLDAVRLRRGVEAVLNDEKKGFYIVAESEGRVVGQLMITYEWSDWRNGNFWWIQSVYVDKEFRGRSIYTQLYRHIEQEARKNKGICGIRLYVEHSNSRAQAIYKKLGMRPTVYEMYETDFVMGRE